MLITKGALKWIWPVTRLITAIKSADKWRQRGFSHPGLVIAKCAWSREAAPAPTGDVAWCQLKSSTIASLLYH
jgi:hypothetical protein